MHKAPDRTKPPKPASPKSVSFPRYFVKTLTNGLKYFVVENHELPIVTIGLIVRSGSAYDFQLPGLASLTAELLTKGTNRRNAIEIAEEIDYLGGSLNSSANWDSSQIFLSVLKKHLKRGIDILQDVVLNPTFPKEEVARETQLRISEIKQMNADPSYLTDKCFSRVIFGQHPYAQPSVGIEQSVISMKREDFVKFHKTHYTPDNSFLIFAGDINPSEAGKIVGKFFSHWKKSEGLIPPIPIPSPVHHDSKIFLVDKPDAVQSTIKMGHLGIARSNPDFTAVSVMNTLLGGYFSSRINANIREAHGYTYGARSAFEGRSVGGVFYVSADVRNEVTAEALREILNELIRLRETLPSKDEMNMVKNYLLGLFPIQLETPQQVASRIITMELYGLPSDYYRKYRERISKITSKDIQKMAKKYVNPDEILVVVTGSKEHVYSSLNNFGPIEICRDNTQPQPKYKAPK
ncbi:MAG: M16 family metallopeptidase [Candidatus Kryptoniota bacterium]